MTGTYCEEFGVTIVIFVKKRDGVLWYLKERRSARVIEEGREMKENEARHGRILSLHRVVRVPPLQ